MSPMIGSGSLEESLLLSVMCSAEECGVGVSCKAYNCRIRLWMSTVVVLISSGTQSSSLASMSEY